MKKMIKKYRGTLLITSLVTLAPMLFGIVFWNQFPESMAVHWGMEGEADGYAGRYFIVYGIPLIMLATQWICFLVTVSDKRNENQSRKAMTLVLWTIPVVSIFATVMLYLATWRMDFETGVFVMLPLALIFVLTGNYMPKFQPNSAMGIRVPWTFSSEENWVATHRMGGRLWVIGGSLLFVFMFLPTTPAIILMIVDLAVLCVVPIVYSYRFYKKQLQEGTLPAEVKKGSKLSRVIAGIVTVGVIIYVCVLMFAGDIRYTCNDNYLEISPNVYHGMDVSYEGIDSIELVDTEISGQRTNGWGSARLLLGEFKNDEFGYYTRYTYTNVGKSIVIRKGNEVLVLGAKDEAETEALYEELLKAIED